MLRQRMHAHAPGIMTDMTNSGSGASSAVVAASVAEAAAERVSARRASYSSGKLRSRMPASETVTGSCRPTCTTYARMQSPLVISAAAAGSTTRSEASPIMNTHPSLTLLLKHGTLMLKRVEGIMPEKWNSSKKEDPKW